MGINHSKRAPVRAVVVLLLCTVGGLPIAAKQSQFLPKSNPTHFLSSAAKMNVAHPLVLFFAGPAYLPAKTIPPQAEFCESALVCSEEIDFPQISLTISLQHRSPPPVLL